MSNGGNASAKLITLNHGSGMTLTASAALVVDNDQVTLVDPGSVRDVDKLVALIEQHGVAWSSVTQVFYTHLHFDHYDLFAFGDHIERVFFPRKEVEYITTLMAFKDDAESYKQRLIDTHEKIGRPFLNQFVHRRNDARYQPQNLAHGGRIVHYDGEVAISQNSKTVPLPGHCHGQHGLSVRTHEGWGVIVGDAVLSEPDWCDGNPEHHLIMANSEQWKQSRDRIANYNWILPGHGPVFYPNIAA